MTPEPSRTMKITAPVHHTELEPFISFSSVPAEMGKYIRQHVENIYRFMQDE